MPKKTYSKKFRANFVEEWPRYEGSFDAFCERLGVTRQTGYEWLDRFEQGGYDGLEPRSSAPHSVPHATSDEIVKLVITARRLHPTWGPRKLRPWILARHQEAELPVASTMTDILRRAGLITPRRRRVRTPRFTQPFAAIDAPNDTWSADFKGQFRTGDGQLCYPLTITDSFSRCFLRCDGYLVPNGDNVRKSFEAAFVEFGLPRAILTDNGTPFASVGAGGLSRLSVWWVHLGITPQRIVPGQPWQNGRHERMHRTLKADIVVPPRANLAAQHRAFQRYRHEYNHERPHEALGQRPPATAYSPSPRPYPRKLPELAYPDDFDIRRVNAQGSIKWRGRAIFISEALIGESVGVHQESDEQWAVHFGPIFLGHLSQSRPELGLLRPPRPPRSRAR